jgi:hypothetical protein
MRTESTFSFGAFALDMLLLEPVEPDEAVELVEPVDDEPEPIDDERSSVPVTSTLWPTCGLSFESSASRR